MHYIAFKYTSTIENNGVISALNDFSVLGGRVVFFFPVVDNLLLFSEGKMQHI